MPKTINTPREELVCGKIEELMDVLVQAGLISAIDLLKDIQHDCNRMEQGLIRRKEQVAKLSMRSEFDLSTVRGRENAIIAGLERKGL